jgi:hypothetical protein
MKKAKAIGTAVLETLADNPKLGAVLVLVLGDEYHCIGVRHKGLKRFVIDEKK